MTGCGPAALVLAVVLLAPRAVAQGDAARGERVFQYCYSCHTVDPAETQTLQGPSLVGIVGRRIAAEPGFAYSPALRAFAAERRAWTEGLLERFIAAPEALVPKTSMHYAGVEDARERADLMAYLKAAAR